MLLWYAAMLADVAFVGLCCLLCLGRPMLRMLACDSGPMLAHGALPCTGAAIGQPLPQDMPVPLALLDSHSRESRQTLCNKADRFACCARQAS